MNYLSRLVRQSGLTLEAAPAPAPVAPPEVAQRAAGIEEIVVETDAPPPEARRDGEPTPDVSEPLQSPGIQSGPPVAAPAKTPSEPERPPHPPAADAKRPRAHEGEDATAEQEAFIEAMRPDQPGPRSASQAEEAEARRAEVLRRVFEWVAPNDAKIAPEPTVEELEVRDVELQDAPTASDVRDVEPEIVETVAALRIGPEAPEDPAPPPETVVEIVEPAPLQESETRPAVAPREERVEVTIGAINLTVEAPPAPAAPATPTPVQAAPPPAPSHQPSPARRTSPANSGDRLRRRFIRV